MRLRSVLAASVATALVVALLLSLSGCATIGRGLHGLYKRAVAPTPNSAPPSHPVVTGFQPSWGDLANLDNSKAGMSMVAISGIDIGSDGSSVTAPSADVLKQLQHAHALGKKAEVLLLNYQGGVGFSDAVAASMLGTEANRISAAASLAAIVKSSGFDGVMFDLESLSSSEAPNLTRFAAALRAAVGPSIHLDAAIQPSTTPEGYRRQGYDIPGLLTSLDNITVMAYDQHGTFNPANPGPVGELSWQKKVLRAMLILAKPGQVDLGVAGYGYRWASDGVHPLATSGHDGWWRPRARHPSSMTARASGRRPCPTVRSSGGRTLARSPCARSWRPRSACTGWRCGRSRCRTRCPRRRESGQ